MILSTEYTTTNLHHHMMTVLAVVVVVVCSNMMPLIEAKNAHFTMEFIPTFKNGLPHKCNPSEVAIMERFLGEILTTETQMVEHNVEYLDRMYETDDPNNHMKRHHFTKVRGFDFSFDCPTTKDQCGESDWCHVLCLDETIRPGHESVTDMATHLKNRLHSEAKTLEGPMNIKCLGHTEKLDFHLLVSVSP
jgi:hypothetical protein